MVKLNKSNKKNIESKGLGKNLSSANHEQSDFHLFSSTVAHKIRNSLASISLNFEQLSQEVGFQGDCREMANDIKLGIDKIATTLNEVVAYSRPIDLDLIEGDIHELVDICLEKMSPFFQKANVNIVKDYYLNRTTLALDFQLLGQAFQQLFLNSLQAMPQGGNLLIRTSSYGKSLKIIIQDTGCGIQPENMTFVFHPFFTTNPQGTGSGLSMVQKAVEAHGGTIDFESNRGKGTAFTLRFPL